MDCLVVQQYIDVVVEYQCCVQVYGQDDLEQCVGLCGDQVVWYDYVECEVFLVVVDVQWYVCFDVVGGVLVEIFVWFVCCDLCQQVVGCCVFVVCVDFFGVGGGQYDVGW